MIVFDDPNDIDNAAQQIFGNAYGAYPGSSPDDGAAPMLQPDQTDGSYYQLFSPDEVNSQGSIVSGILGSSPMTDPEMQASINPHYGNFYRPFVFNVLGEAGP